MPTLYPGLDIFHLLLARLYISHSGPKSKVYGWHLSNCTFGIEIAQPKDFAGRREVAEKCQKHLDLNIPFLVDSIDDSVGSQYSGMPNRLYLIDRQGRIAFKNGRGPFGFHPRQLEQALILLANPSGKLLGITDELLSISNKQKSTT